MSRRRSCRCVLVFLRAAFLLASALPVVAGDSPPASRPAEYPVGAEIEATFTGRWWDATVLAREGQQRVQVRYSDNTTAWLTPDDLRQRGASPEMAAKLSKETRLFAVGAKVEAKFGSNWYDATILKRDGPRLQVKYAEGFSGYVNAATEVRTRAVLLPIPAAAAPATPVAAATTNTTAPPATAAQADPYPAGAQVEAMWGRTWYDATVVSREPSGKWAVTYSDGARGSVAQNEIRERGVAAKYVAPDKQGQYLGAGAKVEYAQGPWWHDGVVVKREAVRAFVRDVRGFERWINFTDIRTREVAAGGPGIIAPNAPVAATTNPTTPDAGSGNPPPAGANPLVPDATGARTIAFAKPPAGWPAAPDPAAGPARPSPQPQPVPLPPMAGFAGAQNAIWQHVSDFLLSYPGANQGLVVHTQEGPGVPYLAQVERIDLATGTLGLPIGFPEGVAPFAVSSDLHRVLARPAADRDHQTLEVWSMEPKPGQNVPSRVKEIQPFAGGAAERSHTAHVTDALFIDADHILVAGLAGELAMIDVPGFKVIWTTKTIEAEYRIALSPGRGQVAVPTEFGIFLLDPLTGNILALLEGGRMYTGSQMSFSPDGKRLLGNGGLECAVWDLESGKRIRSFDLAAGHPANTGLDWITDDFVLLGGRSLLDLERRLVVWTYKYADTLGHRPVTASAGGRFWYVAAEPSREPRKAQRRQLVPVTLITDDLKRALADLQPETMYAWYPGAKVSLSVNVNAGADEQQKITRDLTQAVTKRGLAIAENQPLRLEATTTSGESRTVKYNMRRFGAGGGPPTFETQEATFAPTILRLAILDATSGKTLWESKSQSGGYPPMMITLKEGQTAQDYLNQFAKPNYAFFSNATLPEYVPLPREKEGFGESTLTIKGIQ
jgi:hypothetical protein